MYFPTTYVHTGSPGSQEYKTKPRIWNYENLSVTSGEYMLRVAVGEVSREQ